MSDERDDKTTNSPPKLWELAAGAAALSVLAYFLVDWQVILNNVASNYFQWGVLFVLGFWFFSATAWNKGERGCRPYLSIAGLCAGLLVIFAFVTEGYGCSPPRSNSDCHPAGPTIYNDC